MSPRRGEARIRLEARITVPSRTALTYPIVSIVLLLIVAGCDPRSAREETTGEAGPSAASAEGRAELPPGLLEDLAEAFPRLRPDPLPEPRSDVSARGARQIPGPVREALPEQVLERVRGEATFYADYFEGRRTASGIPFRQNQMVAAHRAYPFGTLLRVTNLRNDRSVNVRVVDRGPFGTTSRARSTVIDLSRRAAQELGFVQAGRTPVRVEVLAWGRGITSGG